MADMDFTQFINALVALAGTDIATFLGIAAVAAFVIGAVRKLVERRYGDKVAGQEWWKAVLLVSNLGAGVGLAFAANAMGYYHCPGAGATVIVGLGHGLISMLGWHGTKRMFGVSQDVIKLLKAPDIKIIKTPDKE